MAKVLRVLYDFTAEEEGELTVKSGQLVMLKDGGAAADGWTHVQSTTPPVKFGFVPSDYLQPVTGASTFSSSSARTSPPEASPASSSSSAYYGVAAAASSSSYAPGSPNNNHNNEASFLNRLGGGVPGSPAGSLGASSVYGGASGVGSAAAAAAVEEFGQLFASHEEWFRAATAKRKETYSQLISEANDISRALSEVEARGVAVLGRVNELEKVISDEKARWQQRVAEDGGVA